MPEKVDSPTEGNETGGDLPPAPDELLSCPMCSSKEITPDHLSQSAHNYDTQELMYECLSCGHEFWASEGLPPW